MRLDSDSDVVLPRAGAGHHTGGCLEAGGRGLAEAGGRGQAQVSRQWGLGRGQTWARHSGTPVKQVIHCPGHGVMQILVDSSEHNTELPVTGEDPEPCLTLLLIDCAVTLR